MKSLNELLKKDTSSLNAEVEYKGIFFKVRYVSRSTLLNLSKSCMIMKYSDQKKTRDQVLDGDLFTIAFCKASVTGWTGATPNALSRLIPMDISAVPEADRDTDLDFSQDNLVTLVKNAYELDSFLQDFVVDIANFRPHQEEILGNSEPSPSGN